MEILGATSALAETRKFLLSLLPGLSQPPGRDFLDYKRVSIWSNETSSSCFLKVFDLPLNGEPGTCVARTTEFEGLEKSLADILALNPGTIRVYIEDLPDRTAYDAHLQSRGLGTTPVKRRRKHPSLSDSPATLLDSLPDLLAQGDGPSHWLRMQGLMLALPDDPPTPFPSSFSFKRPATIPHNIFSLSDFCVVPMDQDRAVGKFGRIIK